MKLFLAMILLAVPAVAQSATDSGATTETPVSTSEATPQPKQTAKPGAGHDIGGGAANIGEGAAKGTGNLAKGSAKGAADLVTLHPVGAATSIAGGAASAGKDVAVGSAKGVGKITRGFGKLIKKAL